MQRALLFVFLRSMVLKAKCPYWSKTPHQTIPLYYYLQINLCLECADREWCDFISWTPGAYKVIRVTRDRNRSSGRDAACTSANGAGRNPTGYRTTHSATRSKVI